MNVNLFEVWYSMHSLAFNLRSMVYTYRGEQFRISAMCS